MNDTNSNTIQLQDPNTEIKPKVTIDQALEVVWRVYGLKTKTLNALPGYEDWNYFFQANEEYDNKNVHTISPDGYVLKVFNSLHSSNPKVIEAQHALLNHVMEKGVVTQSIIQNKKGSEFSIEEFTGKKNNGESRQYAVRIVTYVSGLILDQTPQVAGTFRNVGEFVGKLEQAIQGFHHPFYDTYNHIWNMFETPKLRSFIEAVKDKDDRKMVEECIYTFEKVIVPESAHFKKGMIHGDVSAQNLIVHKVPVREGEVDTGIHDVTAILDFAGAISSYTVVDVAGGIMYLSFQCPEEKQLDAGGHFLAGYYKNNSLNESEKKSLRTLMCARLCQSLVLGAHSFSQQPENEYLLLTSKRGWPLLRKLWNTSDDELYCRWNSILKSYGQ